jgi:hypothetical protein
MAALLKNVEKNGASNCPRGKPLWMRECKACLDVAASCKLESINEKGGPNPGGCPALRNKLREWLEKEHLRNPPTGMDVRKKIEELAMEGHVRAQQVVEECGGRGCLKTDGTKVGSVVKDWKHVIAEQDFIEKTPCEMGNEWRNWDAKRKEAEALAFVKTWAVDKDAQKEEAELKAASQVSILVSKQRIFVEYKEDFLPSYLSKEEAQKILDEKGFVAGELFVEEFFKVGLKDEKRGGDYKRPPSHAERSYSFPILKRYFDRHGEEFSTKK